MPRVTLPLPGAPAAPVAPAPSSLLAPSSHPAAEPTPAAAAELASPATPTHAGELRRLEPGGIAGRLDEAPPSPKAAICGRCKERVCCFSFSVEIDGADVWRISQALAISPEVFLAYHETTADERCFTLDGGPRKFRLMLESHPRLTVPPTSGEGPGTRACTFLLRLPGGQHRCGLGSLRPTVCRHFPVFRRGPLLEFYEGAGCVRRWSMHEIDHADEVALATAYEAELEEYQRFLDEWNELVRRTPEPDRDYGFNFFVDCLLNWYATRAACAAEE